MTVASPGAVKSAANCFSGKIDNRHTPPGDPGISMGGFAVDNGFVVPFSKKTCAIRNTRDAGTGLDRDYRIFVLNEARGCCAWQSVTAGSRFGAFFSPDGWIGCDLFNESLISEAIYLSRPNNASSSVTSIGDFGYEAAKCIAATAQDNDAAYLIGRIEQSRLYVHYRATIAAVARPSESASRLRLLGRRGFERSSGVPPKRRKPVGLEPSAQSQHDRHDSGPKRRRSASLRMERRERRKHWGRQGRRVRDGRDG
jgi:hypothetical protein